MTAPYRAALADLAKLREPVAELTGEVERQRPEAPRDATMRIEVSELADALDRLGDLERNLMSASGLRRLRADAELAG